MPAAGADLVSASYTRSPQEPEKPKCAGVFTPACSIFSTIALIINGAGCGNVTIHAPSAPGRSALAMAISGVFVSRATLAMASGGGAPARVGPGRRRGRGRGGGRAGRADDDVDLVFLDQLARIARGRGRVGGIVERDQLHLVAPHL